MTDPLELHPDPGFAAWLEAERVSVVLTTGPDSRLVLLGAGEDGQVRAFDRVLDEPRAVAATSEGGLLVSTRFQVWLFQNALETGEHHGVHDALYVPRRSWVTGGIGVSEIQSGESGAVLVNTRYSCLASLSDSFSFEVLWKPPFVTALAPDDRCHLSGLALLEGRPAYVTAAAGSDVPEGWRDHPTGRGLAIDARTGETVGEGLSLPHAPRVAGGRLWLIDSGTRRLGWIDTDRRSFHPVATLPGFARCLAIRGPVALVGLCGRDRPGACELRLLDLESGRTVAQLRVQDQDTREIRGLALLEGGFRSPAAVGFGTDEIRRSVTLSTGAGRVVQRAPIRRDPRASSPGRAGIWTGRVPLADVIARYGAFVFPDLSYRPPERALVDPVWAAVLAVGDAPAGVALAGLRQAGGVEMFSLLVQPSHRRQRYATRLVEALETELAGSGCPTVEAFFQTRWSGSEALARILRNRGWMDPVDRRFLYRLDRAEIPRIPLVATAAQVPGGYEILAWRNRSPAQESSLRQEAWFDPRLTPFGADDRLEPSCSIAMVHQERLIGWSLVHRARPGLAHCSTMALHPDHRETPLLEALLAETLRRAVDSSFDRLVFVVEAAHPSMLDFATRRLDSHFSSRTTLRASGKRLGGRT